MAYNDSLHCACILYRLGFLVLTRDCNRVYTLYIRFCGSSYMTKMMTVLAGTLKHIKNLLSRCAVSGNQLIHTHCIKRQ